MFLPFGRPSFETKEFQNGAQNVVQANYIRKFTADFSTRDDPLGKSDVRKLVQGRMSTFHTLEWRDGALRMLDQRQLPGQVIYLDFTDYHHVAEAIRDMVVRGAPAIGAAAAWGLALVGEQTPVIHRSTY